MVSLALPGGCRCLSRPQSKDSEHQLRMIMQEQHSKMNVLVFLVFYCIQAIVAVDTLVDVGYSQYRGVVVGEGTSKWLGIRYAAPPLGPLRFAAPQKPSKTNETQDASKVRVWFCNGIQVRFD